MKNLLRASLALLAVAGVFLALTAYRHARSAAQKTQTVFVNFEGPWAFARDPNDPNRTPNIDSNVLQAKIDAQGVQHALSAKSERYAIRLPRPEAYVATSKERSRAGSAYPPAASTEKDYVTGVSLRYSVDKLSGFSLAGKPDDASPFNRLPVDSPVISFVIDPLPGQMMMECSMHVREAFRDLAKLVNLKMFVDFPSDPSACREHDPQKPPA